MEEVQTSLGKSFCQDLIQHTLFDEAVKLVKESYKLKVEANQSKSEFKIKANGIELLDLVETLLESWLKRKKANKGNSTEDRIKAADANPLLDISDGRVVWVFWGDKASKLISPVTYTKLVKELKGPSVDITHDKKSQTLHITCKFEVFKDVKTKVDNVKTLTTSGQDGLDKSQKSDSKNSTHIDVSKTKGSKDSKESEIKGSDSKGKSHFETPMTFSQAGSDKPQKSDIKGSSHINGSQSENNKDNKKSETKENYVRETSHSESAARNDIPESLKPNEPNQSKGASGGQNLSHQLEKSDCAQDPSPHSSNSEDENANDDKLLFRTPSAKTKVFVYEASIVSLPGVSAIVNAANDRLWHGGGVAYHISKAAGGDKSKLEKECRDYIESNGKIAVTRNFTSSAGDLPYDGVIHAVGPMWSDYKAKDVDCKAKEECAKDLCLTIFNVLVEADARKFSKIALPAISSGIFGVPKRMCAEMYIKGVMDYDSKGTPTQVKEIHFVDINKDILQEIKDAYGRWNQNHKSQDKKAQGTTSGLAGQIAETVHPTSVPNGHPVASQCSSNNSKMSTFQLSKTTCVKVYVCSIVEVKDVDAIACEVDTDFSIKRHAVAQAIKKAGGTSYEEEFTKMVKAKSGSGEDIFICKTGGSLKSNKIGHVIHIKCEKFENSEDMDKLKHLYIQVIQLAKKEKMQTIVMPLIGAASLKEATEDVSAECSRLFAKILKEVVESGEKEMNVKEIHLVDQNEKLINFISRAFQELNTANMDDMQAKGETKSDPSSKSTSDDPKEDSPKPKSGPGKGWLKVHENGSDNCSFKGCKRRGTKRCADCNGFLCDVCTTESSLSTCPFCQKKFDLKTV